MTSEGVPQVPISIAGREWIGVVDTGFNGDLELPYALGPHLNSKYRGRTMSQLADGSIVVEESYEAQVPFDGELVEAIVTFASVNEILIGTRILRRHRVEIDFPKATVLLQRER